MDFFNRFIFANRVNATRAIFSIKILCINSVNENNKNKLLTENLSITNASSKNKLLNSRSLTMPKENLQRENQWGEEEVPEEEEEEWSEEEEEWGEEEEWSEEEEW
jgi:hypothetical protein